MATTALKTEFATSNRLNIARVALAAAFSASAFALLCWIGARIGFGPATHMYVQLFSDAGVTSAMALIGAICWSLVGGLVAGGLFAFIYNLLSPLDAR